MAHNQPSYRSRVVPNPTDGAAALWLTVPAAGEVRVSLCDAIGQERILIALGTLLEASEHTIALPVEHLKPGLYLVLVTGPAGRTVQRLQRN